MSGSAFRRTCARGSAFCILQTAFRSPDAPHAMPYRNGTFQVRIGDAAYEVDLENGQLTMDGQPVDYAFERIDDGSYLLLLDDRSYPVLIEERQDGTLLLTIEGAEAAASVKDEKALLLERFGLQEAAAAGEQEVRAPMPGLVLEIQVEEGRSVETGDPLLVLEAMKMENELRAPVSGIVETIHVENGDAVDKNELLLEITS